MNFRLIRKIYNSLMPWKDYDFQQANYLNSQSVWLLESKVFGLTTVNEVGLFSGLVFWHQT